MDSGKVIFRRRDQQGATRKYYKKKDGSLALVIEIETDVFFGRLIAVKDRTVLDGYADALRRAREALRTGVEAGDTQNALADFESVTDAALALLREGLSDEDAS